MGARFTDIKSGMTPSIHPSYDTKNIQSTRSRSVLHLILQYLKTIMLRETYEKQLEQRVRVLGAFCIYAC
jgi:hypothetical protein